MNQKRSRKPQQGKQLKPIRRQRSNKKSEKEESPQNLFTIILLGVCLCAALFTLFMKQSSGPGGRVADSEVTGGLKVGTVAPAFHAPDWINGKSPELKDLKGKVYVLNAWGLGCVYCRKYAPVLVKAQNRFKDQGVQFIGMTGDTRLDQEKLEGYLKKQNISWPNGTGAAQFMRDYKVEAIPAVWVVDKSGTIVWNYDSKEQLEEAIENALASN